MAEAVTATGTAPNNSQDSAASRRTQDDKNEKEGVGKSVSRSSSSSTTRPSSVAEKKLPPIKAPVWNAPPPKIKQAKSKIGSLQNVTHKPKGGEKKVESQKLEWNAKSKVGSLDYVAHKPSGGDKKIATQKLDFKNVQSKVGSKDNLKHKPGGGTVKVATEKLDFKSKASSKVGSLDNAKHKPGGGNVVIQTEKLHFKEKAAPKIYTGSEKGSSHGGSETGSPIPPSSPAPPENLPPLSEVENQSNEEVEQKMKDQPNSNKDIHEQVACNGEKEHNLAQTSSPIENKSDDTGSLPVAETNTSNEANADGEC